MTSGQHAIMETALTEHIEKYSGPMLRTLALSWLMLCVAGPAHAEETFVQDPAPKAAQEAAQEAAVVFNLAGSSDQQIGMLLQRWPQLDATQRRDLLAEVRKRMRSATQVKEVQGASAVRNKTPSLTLRIKRAQTQHSYGRSTPRSGAAETGEQLASVERTGQSGQRPRELVIRTTVTQILPDGSRITRQETLVPSSLQARLARQEERGTRSTPVDSAAQESQQNPTGNTRVRRTTVRFGSGFHQRYQQADSLTAFESGVRRVATPDARTASAAVLIPAPTVTTAPEAN